MQVWGKFPPTKMILEINYEMCDDTIKFFLGSLGVMLVQPNMVFFVRCKLLDDATNFLRQSLHHIDIQKLSMLMKNQFFYDMFGIPRPLQKLMNFLILF